MTLYREIHDLDKRLATLQTSFEKDIARIEKERELQAKEYERRLRDLNGEQARIALLENKFVDKTIFDLRHGEHEKKIDSLTTFKDNYNGKTSISNIISASALFVAIVALALKFIH